LNNKKEISDAYKQFSESLEDIEEKDKKDRKETLRKGVLDLEQKYKEEIQSTHAMDERLVKLRQEAGMPDLIGVGDKVDKKRFKDKNKYDQFLAKEVMEVGIEESYDQGGVITFKDFSTLFAKARPNWVAPKKELKKALERLAVAGLIPKMYKMKNKEMLITFKPAELQKDLLLVLNVASMNGKTTVRELQSLLGWSKERAELNLQSMVEGGIAYYDKNEQEYFFPALNS
jgi:hypothetical protein